jgi:DNA/RNA-binding domain of Phe-tRNA-synthetase-like protein
MADARVSVLIDIRSRLANLERATAGFGNLLRGVVAATAAYMGFRAAFSNAREILQMGADLDHLSKQTGVAVADLATLRQAFADNGIEPQKAGKAINDMQRRIAEAARGMG